MSNYQCAYTPTRPIGQVAQQPSIYKSEAIDEHSVLKASVRDKVLDAKFTALEQLGKVVSPAHKAAALPLSMQRMDIPGVGNGVFVHLNGTSGDDRSTPAIGTPLKWVAGILTGLCLPMMSFCLGRDFAAVGLAERKSDDIRAFRGQVLPRFSEANGNNEDHNTLTKIGTKWQQLQEHLVSHRVRSTVAKSVMAAGVALGWIVGALSFMPVVAAVVAAPLFIVGTSLLWAEWGYSSAYKHSMDTLAHEVIRDADALLVRGQQETVGDSFSRQDLIEEKLPEPVPSPRARSEMYHPRTMTTLVHQRY